MFRKIILSAMVAMLFFVVQGKASGSIVANGDFGTGDLTGWTLSGEDASWVFAINDDPGTPQSYVQLSSNAAISQSIATVAGQSYTVSFWLANSIGDSSNFQALWNGDVMTNLSNVPSLEWYQYTYAAIGSASGFDTISFSFQQPGQGVFSLTNVEAAPVPLPAALLLFAPGLAAIAVVRKRVTK